MTPYQTLKRNGASIVELPITLNLDGSADRQIYVAKVPAGVRIGELHAEGETSFVIPSAVLGKLLGVISSWPKWAVRHR